VFAAQVAEEHGRPADHLLDVGLEVVQVRHLERHVARRVAVAGAEVLARSALSMSWK
jgi:hypothetical protein